MNTTADCRPALPSASRKTRWTVLFLVATVMMAGYVFWDIVSPISTSLRMPVNEGGMGWTQAEYGFYAGSYSFFNVFLLMLFLGGILIDKCGICFAGLLATGAMLTGAAINFYAIRYMDPHHIILTHVSFFGLVPAQIKAQVLAASLGFGLFGVGCDITGITVSKVITKWFTGYELASAMGIQVAMARLGTASALSFSPLIAEKWGISSPILVGVGVLLIGFLLFASYTLMDRNYNQRAQATHTETSVATRLVKDSFRFRDLLQVLRNPGFWLIALLCVFFYSSIRPFMKFATDLMISKYGVPETTAGWIVAVIPYGTIVLTPLFGTLYDRLGRGVQLMFAGCIVLTLCHIGLAIPAIHNTGFALFIMVLIGISFSLVPSALWPSVPKIVPIKMLGSAYSIIYYIQNIGLALVPMLIGRLNDIDASYTTSLSVFACFAGGGVLLSLALFAIDRKKGYGLQKANFKNSFS